MCSPVHFVPFLPLFPLHSFCFPFFLFHPPRSGPSNPAEGLVSALLTFKTQDKTREDNDICSQQTRSLGLIYQKMRLRPSPVFSERELKFMFAICHRPSVSRLSSVTFVRPTQAIEIFGNISTSCATLAIRDLCIKILRRSSQGNPPVGGVKHKRGSRI